MKQEEKQLLLADLSARLTFHCRVFYEYVDDLDNKTYGYSLTLNTWCIDEFNAGKAVVKPYLRPMSSMTEEERQEYLAECDKDDEDSITTPRYHGIDWLNKKMFDYRGLIPMGLALDAPNDMYKI